MSAIGTVAAPQGEEAVTQSGKSTSVSRLIFLIGSGLFVTSIAQDRVIGRLPLQYLLKDHLHLGAEKIAAFFAVSAFAWYLKPLAGLVVDAFPLFGTRRRYYLLFSALLAGVVWLLLGVAPHTYMPLLALALVLNILMMVASTIVGGLLVQTGQTYGATGRLSSLRMGITNLMGLIVGPLGGFLAGRAFGLTAGLGAGLLFTLAFLTFRLLKEPKSTSVDQESFRSAVKQLQKLLHSRSLWTAAGMTFLFYIAPGFGTPLFFYQSETLKLKPQFIGNLAVISGITGLLAAGLYGALCRKLPLRVLLASGVAINAVGTLAYLAYRSPGSAIAIEGLNGVIATLALLPLFDLAARATPKGSESMGYALLMSVGNLASAFSEVSGSWLYEHLHLTFLNLVWVNAGTTAIGLLAIPFLPAFLMRQRDGD